MKSPTIAVVMTVHNRRENTRRAIQQCRVAADKAQASIAFFVCDDGSTDGTREMLDVELAPEGKVLYGNGHLYWAGGMRHIMRTMWSELLAYDWVILLNDDTYLFEDGILSLLGSREDLGDKKIVVGTTIDPASGKRSYGGLMQGKGLRALTFSPANQQAGARVDTLNANAVLVGRAVLRALGPLASRFSHALADIDYGLTAQRNGIPVVLGKDVVGECLPNPGQGGGWGDASLSRRERLKLMRQPKGLPPAEWWHFCWKHAPLVAVPYFASPWVKILLKR